MFFTNEGNELLLVDLVSEPFKHKYQLKSDLIKLCIFAKEGV